jgi:hypothetical protein
MVLVSVTGLLDERDDTATSERRVDPIARVLARFGVRLVAVCC